MHEVTMGSRKASLTSAGISTEKAKAGGGQAGTREPKAVVRKSPSSGRHTV